MIKNNYVIILILSLSIKINAQNNIIPNGNFESSTSPNCINGINQANDFDAFISNWKVANHPNDMDEGSPDWIKFSYCGYTNDNHYSYCTYFNGLLVNSDAFVVIKADIHQCEKRTIFGGFKIKRTHEAIAVGLENGASFAAYQTYTIRYKIIPIKAENIDTNGDEDHPVCINLQQDCQLRIFLTKKGYHNWNDNAGNIKQELYSANYVTNSGANPVCNWIQVERTFTVDYAGMKNLVLYAESGGFIIDDVEIFQKCDNNVLIQNKNYSFPLYTPNSQNGNHFSEQSSNYINAGYSVGAPNTGVGNVVVGNGSAVVYTAANKISLKPGFRAMNGSYFHALIEDCPNDKKVAYTDNLPQDDSVNMENLTDNTIVKREISIIPNPNEGMFKVLVSGKDRFSSAKTAVVIDCLGKIVWEKSAILTDEFDVNISSHPKGIYYVKVMDDSGNLSVTKIVNQ